MAQEPIQQTTVFAPASLSNFGPGFDILGIAIRGMGDRVEATVNKESSAITVTVEGIHAARVPGDAMRNVAAIAARAVLDHASCERGIRIRLIKGIPVGSGTGGSAASAVAGGFAAHVLTGRRLAEFELIDAIVRAETAVSGAPLADNALSALVGGVVLVDPKRPSSYRKVTLPETPHLALVLPDVQVLTKDARGVLPNDISLAAGVRNAGALALMVDALRSGDWAAVGTYMMRDETAEPRRAELNPCYSAVRRAALDAGAYGCALSGSGPAMVAIADDEVSAARIAAAMEEACRQIGFEAQSMATVVDHLGAREIARNDEPN